MQNSGKNTASKICFLVPVFILLSLVSLQFLAGYKQQTRRGNVYLKTATYGWPFISSIESAVYSSGEYPWAGAVNWGIVALLSGSCFVVWWRVRNCLSQIQFPVRNLLWYTCIVALFVTVYQNEPAIYNWACSVFDFDRALPPQALQEVHWGNKRLHWVFIIAIGLGFAALLELLKSIVLATTKVLRKTFWPVRKSA